MATRIYEFICNSCDYEYSKLLDWNIILKYKPICPMCDKDTVSRNYHAENVIIDDGIPKTLGALADKNSNKQGIKIDGKE